MKEQQRSKKVRRKLFSVDNPAERKLSKEELVTRKLWALGFRVSYKGFYYQRDEVLLAMDNRSKRITKLHEEVASRYNQRNPKKKIKPSNVENCIRTAIDSAWRNKKEKIQVLTGTDKKPAPSKLIFELVNRINKEKP